MNNPNVQHDQNVGNVHERVERPNDPSDPNNPNGSMTDTATAELGTLFATASMEPSSQRVAAAFSQMRERQGLGSRAARRPDLVPCGRPGRRGEDDRNQDE